MEIMVVKTKEAGTVQEAVMVEIMKAATNRMLTT
jgi:hypothetical protein